MLIINRVFSVVATQSDIVHLRALKHLLSSRLFQVRGRIVLTRTTPHHLQEVITLLHRLKPTSNHHHLYQTCRGIDGPPTGPKILLPMCRTHSSVNPSTSVCHHLRITTPQLALQKRFHRPHRTKSPNRYLESLLPVARAARMFQSRRVPKTDPQPGHGRGFPSTDGLKAAKSTKHHPRKQHPQKP